MAESKARERTITRSDLTLRALLVVGLISAAGIYGYISGQQDINQALMNDWNDPLAELDCGENPQGELSTRLEIGNGRFRMAGGAKLHASQNQVTASVGGGYKTTGE